MKIKELFENTIDWEKFKQNDNFYYDDCNLTSLKDSPLKVNGSFHCSRNRLTSLEGAPQKVGDCFSCDENELTSLKGAPQEVGSSFSCRDNLLTSLESAPREVGGYFDCSENKLTSLESAPQKLNGDFYCDFNPIKSLKGIGKNYLKEINGLINLNDCPIESHMLGLLKVKGLINIKFNHNRKVEEILNKHLKSRDLLACQEELIENGLEQYAQL